MKTSSLVPFIVLASTVAAFAQGSLTPPPGAPAPLMKSLDQIEARTPLVAGQTGVSINANGTITISQPGSYYLTSNLTLSAYNVNGIVIGTTSSVTLDLNGFTISNTAATSDTNAGVYISGSISQTVVIRNGHIHGPGFERGILLSSATGGTLLAEDIHTSGMAIGMILQRDSARSIVTNCTVSNMRSTGISADVVDRCTVRNTAGTGIYATTVSGCEVEQESGTGNAIEGRVVQNCSGISQGGVGIVAETATNCFGGSNTGTLGMNISGTASFCRASRAGGTAMAAGIAVACTSSSGSIVSIQKHLGTP